eukprot:150922_1
MYLQHISYTYLIIHTIFNTKFSCTFSCRFFAIGVNYANNIEPNTSRYSSPDNPSIQMLNLSYITHAILLIKSHDSCRIIFDDDNNLCFIKPHICGRYGLH